MSAFSRRSFVGGASAALTGGLAACGGGGVSVPAVSPTAAPSTNYDLIVVGAGIAGIAAARLAAGYGAKTLVLEAQSYVGGRTRTDNTTFSEIPFDFGAQYFHQVIEGNELYAIANADGIPLFAWQSASGGGVPILTSEGKSILAGDAPDAVLFASTTATLRAAVLAYGASVAGTSADQSLATTLASYTSLPFYNDALGPAVLAVTGSLQRSTVDAANFFSVSPGTLVAPGDDYLIRSGMGNFIARLGKGLPIQLNTAVKSIAATAGSPVVVTTAAGQTYRAKAIIVTASVGVLAAGGITFTPALPAAYTAGFAALPMANVCKGLLGFKSTFSFMPTVSGFSSITPIGGNVETTVFVRFWNTNTVEYLADGDLAVQFESKGTGFAAATVLPVLENVFPGATAAWDGRVTQSNWTTNPYTQGSYAAALPGMNGARTTLAQPIGNQLWFAGEALALGGARGSIHGAYRSGLSAANAALRAIGLASSARSVN